MTQLHILYSVTLHNLRTSGAKKSLERPSFRRAHVRIWVQDYAEMSLYRYLYVPDMFVHMMAMHDTL